MIESGECIFSPCRDYRYVLWRNLGDDDPMKGYPQLSIHPDWLYGHPDNDKQVPFLLVIGLNPSTADETKNDPTIRRCISFAQCWGFRRLCMSNIFAFRATEPWAMKAMADPVGPDNDRHLQELLQACQNNAGLALAAWGAHGAWKSRGKHVKAMARLLGVPLHCLGVTANGSPRHPLYVGGNTKPHLLP